MNELLIAPELDEPVRRFFAHAFPAGLTPARGEVRLAMHGRVRAGRWLPFTATQVTGARSFEWRARVGFGPLTALRVLDRFADGVGSTDVRLLGILPVARAQGPDVSRSAAGRAALEAVVLNPAATLPDQRTSWRAEDDNRLVASFDFGIEQPEVRVVIGSEGQVRSVTARRWGPLGQGAYGYLPCGCDVHAERRFGAVVVPSEFSVAWNWGRADSRPFFEATVDEILASP